MFARPTSRLSPLLARLKSSSAPAEQLDRLSLEIHAAANRDIALGTPQEPVTRSEEALRGAALSGDVQLPRELQEAVDRAIERELRAGAGRGWAETSRARRLTDG